MILYSEIKILLLVFLFSSTAQAIEIKSLSHAVDIAGKQRMFTQKMLKDYAMIGLNNRFGNPQADLNKTMISFENHMQSLYDFNKDESTAKSIKEAMRLWKPIKQTLSEAITKDKVAKLQIDLDALLKVANDTTVLFAKQTGKASGEIINISGRQRMLSQRMAGLYMLKTWGVSDPKFQEKMTKAMDLFRASQKRLMAYTKNTDEISNLLKKVKKAFAFFEFMKDSEVFIPSLIYKKSTEMLKDMNTVTGLYVKAETIEPH